MHADTEGVYIRSEIMFISVFRNSVLIFWSTTLAFMKHLHEQMFPLRSFHFRVYITQNENFISVKMTVMK